MASIDVKTPSLPLAPVEYDRTYQDQFNNILRQYFTQLSNTGPMAGSASKVGTVDVVAGLNFSQPDGAGGTVYSFATQADLANLRIGDVYVDTSASNVLKMKTS
jgi:hypothetical protein